jgi:hypothetical protein
MKSLPLFAGRRFWIGLFVLLMIGSAPVYAAGTVTDCSSYGPGTGTLHDALAGGGTITFGCSGTIYVPQIDISGTVTLDATGQTVRLDGSGANRIFLVATGANLTLIHLTVQNGASSGYGGGIYNHGTLTLTNSTVSGNFGGLGAGIYNGGTLTLTNSTVSGNSASTYDAGAGFGGGIFNDGTLTLTNSTISSNFASTHDGGIFNDGRVTLTNSTVSFNFTRGAGGGFRNFGTVTLTNSTVASNSAASCGGGICNFGTVTLTNSTFYYNSAAAGGGINNYGTLNLGNSIIANSPSGGDCYSPFGSINPSGPNLVMDGSCAIAGALSGNPMLGTLISDPAYLPLVSGSPAIDAGDNSICPATDQRGAPRPQDGDGDGIATCDLGSYEADAAVTTPAQDLQNLMNIIQTIDARQGIQTSLNAKLQAAQDALTAANGGSGSDAVHVLEAFINEVQAQQGKRITDSDANELITLATQIINRIQGGY